MIEPGLFKVECLSPVHIGSGDELVRGIDFYTSEGFTEVLDPDRVLKTFGAFEGFAENIRRGVGIGEFLKGRAVQAAACRRYHVPGAIEAHSLRAAIRCGDGRPLIPGSSIKGALRTLLLAGWSGEGAPHSGRRPPPVRDALWTVGYSGKTSSRRLEEAVFHFSGEGLRANDPKTDLLRTLTVSDAMFAAGSLQVISALALGTTRNTLTAAEALERGAGALVSLRAGDEFLDARLPFPNKLPDLQTLASWSHLQARHLLDGDLEFFKARNEDPIVGRLEELLAEVEHAAASAIILRLGWGTGWRTMTGDLLTPDERSRVMRRVGKTRKVIIEGHSSRGRPSDALGWVRIEPVSPDEAAALAAATRPAPIEIEPEPAPMPVAAAPAPAPQPLARRDPFAAAIADLKARDWGRVSGYVKQAASHPDPQERERRLSLIAEQLIRIFGNDRKRIREIAQMQELAPFLKGR